MPVMDTYYEFNGELFVWDTGKADKNLHKHGVRFEEAVTVFFDPMFVLIDASRSDETRHAAIGFDLAGRLLYVVHIEVNESFIRIISARRAEPKEESIYAF
jgi:uncharacterized DUF497 family protein